MVKLFTVYDSKSESWLKPFPALNSGTAIRSFEDIANDEKSEIGRHPGDFSLFEIGWFDEVSGDCKFLDAKINLGCAIQFKKNKEPVPV